jgi:hypothetical protein
MLFAGILFIVVPLSAENSFGTSSALLDPIQRTYLSTVLLLNENDLNKSYDVLGNERSFEVQLGESTYDITNRLEAEGFISNAKVMRDYLVYSGLDTTIQAGEYLLNPRMTSLQIAHVLCSTRLAAGGNSSSFAYLWSKFLAGFILGKGKKSFVK